MQVFLKTEVFSPFCRCVHTEMEVFENVLQSGDFRKHRFRACVRAKTKVFEKGDVMISPAATVVDWAWVLYVFEMVGGAEVHDYFTCMGSFHVCIQLHVAMLNVHGDYLRKRINIMKMFSVSLAQKIILKRLKKKPAKPWRFWVRPRQTTAWWDNFDSQTLACVLVHSPLESGLCNILNFPSSSF